MVTEVALEKYHKALNESITILSFFRLFLTSQYNYVYNYARKKANIYLP